MTQHVSAKTPEAIDRLASDAASGSRESLAELYDIYSAPLWRHVQRRVKDPVLTDDLASETWARVIARIAQFNPQRAQFVTWLYKVADSVMSSHGRREGMPRRIKEVTSHLLHTGSGEASSAPGPEDLAIRQDLARRMAAELRRLPPRQMQALVLTEYEGLSTNDAAQVMGMTLGAFKQLKHRGAENLRIRLAGDLTRNQPRALRVYNSAGHSAFEPSEQR